MHWLGSPVPDDETNSAARALETGSYEPDM